MEKIKHPNELRVSLDRSNIARSSDSLSAVPIFIRSTATSIVRGNAAILAESAIRIPDAREFRDGQTIIIQFPEFL